MTSIELVDRVLELARRELADLKKRLAFGMARPGDADHADTIAMGNRPNGLNSAEDFLPIAGNIGITSK